ncbi:baculoviridae P74 like protein [Drosophila suzukii associated hytrosavirus 1]|nr:baculoviridae P74 like protein [Drosophila suzukii associated hytrosavirus 1]
MVFNAPTLLNYTNADLYAFERRKIQQYNFFLRFRPEIMSHTYIEISYNNDLTDNEDIPWYRKIRFIVRSRKSFCSQATCQSHYPRGNTCRPKDEPRIFKTGDNDMEACQVSCYNLYENSVLDTNEAKNINSIKVNTREDELARAPFLIYSYRQCACTMHNNALFAMGIDDYVRTDNHPMPRIDTIGTGFNYTDSGNFFDDENFSESENQPFVNLDGDESFRFNVNKYYCDDFRLKFDGSKCFSSVSEKTFSFLVSSALYKACQYGVRYAATGVTNTDVQKLELPPIKHRVRHRTINSWKNDIDIDAFFIDPNVSLLDLGFKEDMKHCIFTTEYGYPGKLVEPLASGKKLTDQQVDYAARNKNRLHQFKYDEKTGQRLIDEYAIYDIYKYIRSNPTKRKFETSDYTHPSNQLVDMFKGIVENLGEVGAMLTLGYMLDQGLRYSMKLLKLSAEFLEGSVTPTLLHIVEREFLTQAYHPTIHAFSQTIAAVARTSSSLIKMADVVTTIAGIIDLFDIGLDFFSMNKIMDSGTVKQYSELDIESLRKAYGYGTVEYSPVTFMLTCEQLKIHKKWKKTPATTMKLRCIKDYTKYKYMIPVNSVVNYHDHNENTYEWISEYIFSLKTNSNGLQINWQDEEKLSQEIVDQYLKIDENIYLKGIDAYTQHTESFRKRVNFSLYALIAVIVIFALVMFIYMQFAVPIIFIATLASFYIVFSYAPSIKGLF